MRQLTASARSRAPLALGALAAALGGACAQPGPPPGGPPDPTPPALVRITPESGAVNVRPPELLFRFDEVIGERPASASTLDQLVLVSPRDGAPEVRWRRTGLGVRPRNGWRANTTYVVQLLPGVTDLRGNRQDSTVTVVFSTGPTIVPTRITGVVFDWPRGVAAPAALVQAVVRSAANPRDSAVYVVQADSSGRFTLPHVPAGTVTVRGGVDSNRNFGLDAREIWDESAITLVDSAHVELYAFQRDTVGPQIANVAVEDSVTVRVTLNQPLALDQPLDTALVQLFDADSGRVALAAVLSRSAADSLAALADTSAAADTAAARPALPPTPADTAAPLAGAGPPTPSRPTPVSELVIRTAAPLEPGARYRLVLVGARNLLGAAATSERTVPIPAPPPPQPPADAPSRPPG